MYRLPMKSSLIDYLLSKSCLSFFWNIYKHVQHSQKSPSVQPTSHRRSLHRTLSDESIYRGQRLPSLSDSATEPTLGSDVLFSCSTLPRSPTTRGVPLRRPSYKLGVKLHGKDVEKGSRCLCWESLSRSTQHIVWAYCLQLREMKFGQKGFIDLLYSINTNLQQRETVLDCYIHTFVSVQATFQHLTRHW